MPTKLRRENELIDLFLSAYECDSWADSGREWLDEKVDGSVELQATRSSDGMVLAIEHTLIQPFDGDKGDFARFAPIFLPIEEDASLAIPGQATYVDIPVGTLESGKDWSQIGNETHRWLRDNVKSFPKGRSSHSFASHELNGARITLKVRVVPIPGFPGKLIIRRTGPMALRTVIAKALRTKLPKLVATQADKRILLLERDQFRLSEREIHGEVELRRPEFPELDKVDEIWFAETVFYNSERIVEFIRFEQGEVVQLLSFVKGLLHLREEDGEATIVNPI